MSDICVVGSINMDIVTSVDKYPERGQTIFGNEILQFVGGKGANQSVACAKQEKSVAIIGAVGKDSYGETLINELNEAGVLTREVKELTEVTSGQTTIILDGEAENTIIYVEGANGELTKEDVTKSIQSLKGSKILLAQMETPYETVLQAMKTAKAQGMKVILDPAPANHVTDDMLQYADFVLPNVHETEWLTGVRVVDEHTAREAVIAFRAKGVHQGVLKIGSSGSFVFDEDKLTFIKGIKVDAVDTVGAGDCFAGALASALIDGKTIEEAASYANVVAALKVTKHGAQAGIPTLEEVENFIKEHSLLVL
ncbi:MAG TPA: ribokinase [Bacillota bacterium]|nr:ribokinase [Bacillota bacterium]